MSKAVPSRPLLATIGYESTAVPEFLATLRDAGIELLVDVRAVASSRRPGYAKTALAANLASVGIEYLHLRGLGTPKEGRVAARAGRHAEMHAIFRAHLSTPDAQADLAALADIVEAGRRACLLCLEADPTHCHRSLVADALARRMTLDIVHLHPEPDVD
jgi:uncharacterized protein (DUF488 family)